MEPKANQPGNSRTPDQERKTPMFKPFIFVSYAREDSNWFEKGSLMPRLKASLERENAEVWYDKGGIIGADLWRNEIEKAIDRADIAVLLVSQYFLISDFIMNVELPHLVRKADEKKLILFPILVGYCNWQIVDAISRSQMVPGEPTPLVEYLEPPAKWDRVQHEIFEALLRQIEKLRREREPGRRPPKEPTPTPLPTPMPTPKPTGSTTPTPTPITKPTPKLINEELSLDLSSFTKQTDGTWAFVSGIWALIFCPEPGVTSEERISPGAAFQVLKTVRFQDHKWTNIRLEDSRKGWIGGEPAADRVAGAIMQPFSRIDARTFFATVHELRPRVGFLLARVRPGMTIMGELDHFKFADASWGPISIPMSQMQKIDIDRRTKGTSTIKIQTDNQKYVGEFPHGDEFGHLCLILTRPFIGLNNMKNDLEDNRILYLNTIEYAQLERIPNPHRL